MNSFVALEVRAASATYKVKVGHGLLSRCDWWRELPGKSHLGLIMDSAVAALWGDPVEEMLMRSGRPVVRFTFPAGEASKRLPVLEQLAEQMALAGLDRHSTLVALGGGVTGDLAGFLAAVYYRGIACVQLPTTVTAQVDSSVGGKTGVNLSVGKNLVGSFHQPALVLADTSLLESLPARVFNEGCAEIIKHGVIRDESMLDDITAEAPDWPSIIARNIRIKADVVQEDEKELSGARMLLNFGHTLGHAIETAAGYGGYLHGEAISLGMCAALDLSQRHAGLAPESAQKVRRALAHFDLPVCLQQSLPWDSVREALFRDKKFSQGQIRFVLTPQLGQAYVSETITEEDLRQAFERLAS